MNTEENIDQSVELKKVRKLLAKNIDDFKHLVLYNMRLDQISQPSNEALHLDVNRISDFQEETTESLEEWVNREFAPKPSKKDQSMFTYDAPDETLEQWVARHKIKPKSKVNHTIIDRIEQWLMDEAKKDLFKEMEAKYGRPEELSSEHIRGLGQSLISLADKLDKIK